MLQMVGQKQHNIKNANHRLILEQVRHHGELSRTELTRNLGLSAAGISKNVDELIRNHVLLETGTVATHAGRRPRMLQINRDYGCTAVVDFSSTDTRVALANMCGEFIDYATVPGGSELDDQHLYTVRDLLQQMLKKQSPARKLLAISVATPGDVDRKTGDFLFAPRLRKCTIRNFRDFFHTAFGVDVLVKNDVNLATYGEHLYGAGIGCSDMLYVAVDYGIGSGMVLGGKVYEGARGFAGEIGLWIMDADEGMTDQEPKLLDGRASCFAIRQNICSKLSAGRQSVLQNWVPKGKLVEMDQIFQAYRLRDPLCVEVVRQAALQLACAIKNIIDFLDVELVIIGGRSKDFGDDYLDTIQTFLEKTQPTRIPRLIWASLGHQSALYGGVGDALEFAFDQIAKQNDFPEESKEVEVCCCTDIGQTER